MIDAAEERDRLSTRLLGKTVGHKGAPAKLPYGSPHRYPKIAEH